jgi:conjugal transfer pilus assembly protein TraB
MLEKLRERFKNLTLKQKRAAFALVGLGLSAMLGIAVFGKKTKNAEIKSQAQDLRTKQVRLDPELLRRAAYEENRLELARLREEVAALRADRSQGPGAFPGTPLPGGPAPGSFSADPGVEPPGRTAFPSLPPLPPAPRPQGRNARATLPPPPPLPPLRGGRPGNATLPPPPVPPAGGADPFPPPPGVGVPSAPGPGVPPTSGGQSSGPPGKPPKPTAELIGGIAQFAGSDGKSKGGKDATKEGKEGQPQDTEKKKANGKDLKVYLPPSILPAKLLTGLDASTTGAGKGDPEPMLLRIQAPAILPNSVRANLRGCFIIAEGVGKLAKERVDVRLVSLNCIDNGGHAVIDSKIKGFVTDEDGKGGLSGHVVSRMGAAAARALIAGAVKGGGEAIKSTATTQSLSPLGATQVLDVNEIGRAALGGGVSQGIQPLLDLYVDLAKQAAPIIEKLPGTDVTAIITEGADLQIKTYENKVGGGS